MTDPGTERAKLVRDSLFVTRSIAFEDALKTVRKYLTIDERGHVHPVSSLAGMTDRRKVVLQLLGGFFAKEAQLRDTAEVNLPDLAKACGISSAIAKVRAHELKIEGLIDSPRRGVFQLSEHRLKDALDALEG